MISVEGRIPTVKDQYEIYRSTGRIMSAQEPRDIAPSVGDESDSVEGAVGRPNPKYRNNTRCEYAA